MVAAATFDCYNDGECVTGFYTMIDERLEVPFRTEVLGVDVTVTGIDLGDDQIAAIWLRNRCPGTDGADATNFHPGTPRQGHRRLCT